MLKEFKKTKGRILVLDIIKKSNHPISAQEIVNKIKNKIDQATVYRILNFFENQETIFVDMLKGEKRYYTGKERHHHIVCESCQKTVCVPCSHKTPNVKGFRNIKHNMYLTGICNNCN